MHTQSSFYYERVENKLMCGRESIQSYQEPKLTNVWQRVIYSYQEPKLTNVWKRVNLVIPRTKIVNVLSLVVW